MRKRLFWYVGLFGMVLGLVFGWMAIAVFFLVEDASYVRQLERMLESNQSDLQVVPYVGPVTNVPVHLVDSVAQLPVGKHELDIDGSELHAVVRDQSNGSRTVALLQIPESDLREQAFVIGVWIAVALTSLVGFLIGAWLVRRTVRPIERLTEALHRAEPELIQPDEMPDEELRELAASLDCYLVQRHTQVERERAFLREASHELRNPISVIRGVCELGRERPMSEQARQRIERSVLRMEHTVEGLLCLARQDAVLERVSFSDEFHSMIAEFRETLGKRMSVEPSLTWVPPEPLMGRMVVLALATLLRNAAEHAQAKHVAVQLTESGLRVEDDGVGLVQLAEIQASLEKALPLPGGGLGLSLVQRICRRMEWRLSLSNQTPGFRVWVEFNGGS